MKFKPFLKYSIVILLFLVRLSIYAQDVLWEQTGGPETGTVTLIKSISTGKVVGCLANNRLYLSTDNGKTWSPTNLPVSDLATFTIRENGSIFAASAIFCAMDCSQNGIYYSNDKGETWDDIQVGSVDNFVSFFSTGARGRVFAHTMEGLYYSDSGANTWIKSNIDSPYVSFRTFTSSDNGIVAGVTNHSTYLSLDNGETWVNYPYIDSSKFYINTLAIYNDSVLFGVDYSSLYRSTNSGQIWEKLTLPITPNYINDVQVTGDDQVLLGTDIGAYSSSNMGDTWSRVFSNNIEVYSIACNSENEILLGTSDAVYRNGIMNSTWIRSSQGIIENRVREIICLSNGDLLAGTFYDGLFSSSDGGENWERLYFPTCGSIEAIVEITGGEVAVGMIGAPGLYLSHDTLKKWDTVSLTNIGSLTIGSENTLFAGSVGRLTHGVYRSVDLGLTWTEVGLEEEEVTELAADESGIIYAGTIANGVFRSVDNGETWQQTSLQNENIRALTTSSEKLIFAGTMSGYIFRSEDGGDNWVNVYSPEARVYDFVILPNGVIFAGTSGGVFCSVDNGFTWQDYSTGLPEDTYTVSLTYDTQDYLYAGTRGDGVYKSVTPITTSIQEEYENTLVGFSLMQNYPNPFNPTTNIKYTLANSGIVKLIIYDLLGRKIESVVNEYQNIGNYNIEFNASNLPSGVYLYRLTCGKYTETKKLVLLK